MAHNEILTILQTILLCFISGLMAYSFYKEKKYIHAMILAFCVGLGAFAILAFFLLDKL